MASLLLLSQVLRRTLLSGAYLGAVAVSALAWWALELLMPLGLTTEGVHRLTAHYEVAFMASALVSAATAVRLAGYREVLRPMGPLGRVGAEWLCLAAAGALAAAPPVALAHATRTWQLEEFRPDRSLPALAASGAHLCAALTAALRVTRRRGHLAPLATALAATLLLPGLVPGGSPLSSLAIASLDVSAPLRASFDSGGDHAPWTMGVLPTLGWALIALALASPPAARRDPTPPHALRDPR